MVDDLPIADEPAELTAWHTARSDALAADSTPTVAGVAYPGPLPQRVQAILDTPEGWDHNRSAGTFALVAACFDEGLSEAEAVEVAENYEPAEDKYGSRPGGVADQVDDIWAKLTAGAGPEPEWLTEPRTPTRMEMLNDQDVPRWRALADRRGIPSPTLATTTMPATAEAPSVNGQPGVTPPNSRPSIRRSLIRNG